MSSYGPDTFYPLFHDTGSVPFHIPTAPFLTTPKLIKIERKPYMSAVGLEALNKMVLYQDKIWITATGQVKTIEDLADSHLERIICWLEAGRNWLRTNRSVRVGMTPMYVRLLKERQKRWKKKQTEEQMVRDPQEDKVIKAMIDYLMSKGYSVVGNNS